MAVIKIRLRDIPITIDEQFLAEDGMFYLDLPDDFEITEFKQITELTPNNEFSLNYSISTSLKPTDANSEALKRYWNPNIVDNILEPVKVDVFSGSSVMSDVDLYITNFTLDTIDISLVIEKNHWINNVRGLKLRSLPLGTFHFIWFNIRQTWDNYKFNNTSTGLYFPLINYGDTDWEMENQRHLPIEHFRPTFHVLNLIKKIFCEASLEFVSPFFESTMGTMLVDYLTGEDFNYIADGKNLANMLDLLGSEHTILENKLVTDSFNVFHANKTYRCLQMSTEKSDPGNHVPTANWIYQTASGEIDVKAKIPLTFLTLKILPIDTGGSYRTQPPRLTLLKYNPFSLKVEIIWESEDILEEDVQFVFDIDVQNIPMTFLDRLHLCINYDKGSVCQINPYDAKDPEIKTFIQVTGKRRYLREGETIDKGLWIDKDLDALTYLKEKTIQFNLKWYADLTSNKIYAMQPYQVKILGEIIEGFFIETDILDIIDLIDASSVRLTNPELNKPRYITVGYAESKDPLVAKDMFDRKMDLGVKFTIEDTLDIRLKKFSATYVKGYNGKSTGRPSALRHSFIIPAIRSDKDVKVHWAIQPRTLLAFGAVKHGDGTLNRAKISILGVLQEEVPTASMLPNYYSSADWEGIPKVSLIYNAIDSVLTDLIGVTTDYNLYQLFYKRDLLERYDNQTLNYLTDMERNWFQSISFRNIYQFSHLGRTVICRMNKINSFLNSKDVWTPVDYIPFKRSDNICEDDDGGFEYPPPDIFPCGNNVFIDYVIALPCYGFIINGDTGSSIIQAIFQYRDFDSNTWIDIPTDTLYSAVLCKSDKSFYVRAFVELSDTDTQDCPDVYTEEIYFELCSNEFTLNCSVYKENGIICAVPILTTNVVDYDVVYYYDIGLGFEEFLDTAVCGLEDDSIKFKAIITVGECAPVELESQCFIKLDCSVNNISLVCVDNEGCVSVNRIGTLSPVGILDDYIIYSLNNGETWTRWDELTPICDTLVWWRRVVIFCNSECPVVCSPIIQCGNCSFQVTLTNKQYCNKGNITFD